MRSDSLLELVVALDRYNRAFLPLGAGASPVVLEALPQSAGSISPEPTSAKAPEQPKDDPLELPMLASAGVEIYLLVEEEAYPSGTFRRLRSTLRRLL